MDKYIEVINANINKIISNIDPQNPIREYITYTLLPGGKYLRSTLCLITYNMYSENINEALNLACSIELIHNYSLVHDDLPCMDDDDYRRGKLAAHKKYGEANAVLIGDGLLNSAYELAINDIISSGNSKDRKLKALEIIARKAGISGMIYGQILDIRDDVSTIDDISYMYARKTGDLIIAAVLSGAIMGGANEDELEILNSFANSLGIFFQIRDDIGDYDEDNAIGKQTMISGKTKDEAIEIMDKHVDDCLIQLKTLEDKYARDTSYLKEIISILQEF